MDTNRVLTLVASLPEGLESNPFSFDHHDQFRLYADAAREAVDVCQQSPTVNLSQQQRQDLESQVHEILARLHAAEFAHRAMLWEPVCNAGMIIALSIFRLETFLGADNTDFFPVRTRAVPRVQEILDEATVQTTFPRHLTATELRREIQYWHHELTSDD